MYDNIFFGQFTILTFHAIFHFSMCVVTDVTVVIDTARVKETGYVPGTAVALYVHCA